MDITPKLAAQCAVAAIFLAATSAAHAQQQAPQQRVGGPMTQQASRSEFVRVPRGTISATYTVGTPYKTIQIGDPKIVDVLAITDRSFNLQAQANGITNVILFDEQGVAVKSVTVLVVDPQDPAAHTVKIFNLSGQLSGSSNYECSATTGCQYLGASEIQRVPKEVIEYRGLPGGQGYSPSLRR
jgi:Flp pilus assembly secretin CpaC